MGKQRGARGSKSQKQQTNKHTRTVFKVAERTSALDIKKEAEEAALQEQERTRQHEKRENESLVQLDTRALH